MKTLLILAIALSTYGCKKCATCNTSTWMVVDGQQVGSATYSSKEYCGDDIKEAEGETTSTSTYQGHTATVKSVTSCN